MPEMSLREMQRTQPWQANPWYTKEFENSVAAGEQHRWLAHDLAHIMKAVGVLASIVEGADHGRVRHDLATQADFEKRVADLVICALHIANNPTWGYSAFDLYGAVVERVETVNGVAWDEERK